MTLCETGLVANVEVAVLEGLRSRSSKQQPVTVSHATNSNREVAWERGGNAGAYWKQVDRVRGGYGGGSEGTFDH